MHILDKRRITAFTNNFAKMTNVPDWHGDFYPEKHDPKDFIIDQNEWDDAQKLFIKIFDGLNYKGHFSCAPPHGFYFSLSENNIRLEIMWEDLVGKGITIPPFIFVVNGQMHHSKDEKYITLNIKEDKKDIEYIDLLRKFIILTFSFPEYLYSLNLSKNETNYLEDIFTIEKLDELISDRIFI